MNIPEKTKIKITIVIELYKREMVSVLLLKIELEKRGYQVEIKRKSEDISISACDMLIIPNGYRTSGYLDYRYRFNCVSGKMMNLQWEQLSSRYEEKNNKWTSEGEAKKLVYLCWGENRIKQLSEVGVKKKNLEIVGPIHTDVMREQFDYVWYSRNEISKCYNIDKTKNWLLFISSLTFASQKSVFMNSAKKLIDYIDYNERQVTEEKTQKEIINWLIKACADDDNLIVIYRPHPTEVNSPALEKARRSGGDRFRIISDLDLKQWIKVSNVLLLWNSTSAIECCMSGKKCIILRPYELNKNEEYILYDDAVMAKTYSEFCEQLYNDMHEFPIKKNMLDEYYDIKNEPTYIRICNIVEKVLRDDSYKHYEKKFHIKRMVYLVRRGIILKLFFKWVYCFLFKHIGFKIRNNKIRERFFVDSWENSVVERENAKKMERLIVRGWK